jgi:cardiolipin synthase
VYGNRLGYWRDTFLKIQGSAVHGLQHLFLSDWYFVEKKLITDKKYYPAPMQFDNNLIQIVSSGPDTEWEAIMQGVAKAIMSAKKYIYIQSPYYMPTELIEGCLQLAALSGVDVRIMIPTRSDSPIAIASTSSYLGKVLQAGVRVFYYQKGFLHAKTIVMDDFISIVGSCNIDYRSFYQNFEANAFVYEEKTALTLKELFLQDIQHCEEITLEQWNNRRKSKKLIDSFSRLFSPIL